MVAGATGSGKTMWVFKFLKHLKTMFTYDPPQKILYCYGVYQDLFDEMKRRIPHLTFHEGVPDLSTVRTFSKSESHSLIILDDLMSEVGSEGEAEKLFTRGAHHLKLSVLYLVQNLFHQGKHSRTIHLNTQYIALFKNYRDPSQVLRLARQICPNRAHVVMEAYRKATSTPFGYLLIDLHPRSSNDKNRLQTGLFPGQKRTLYKAKQA